jgi:hypothetical protein
VLILGALAAPVDPALPAQLGASAHERLRAVLRARTLGWGRAVGGGADPLDAEVVDEVPGLLARAGHSGPIMLAAPDVPGLREDLATAALADLAAGLDLSVGPTGDGSTFFVAIARSDPALLGLVGVPFPEVAVAAGAAGLRLGMLRSERRLVTPADGLALLADPMAPHDLTELLGPLR